MTVPRETLDKFSSLHVSRETVSRLSIFVDLLSHWNSRINLIGPADLETIWSRHVLDSLQLIPLIPPATTHGIDVGSGAGFPGLLLSMASGISFDLVEADHRKAAFLREAIRVLHAPAKVHASRIEECSLSKAALVTSRALAPLKKLLSLSNDLLADNGVALFPKGARAESEIQDASTEWTMRVERFKSITDPSGVILRISEVARV